ncbi:alpha/beta hydrolase [Sediminibacillus albus]|uniref:Pimeloyl-ACP methyl ester carboxylesterase n=1 Tax=Sediminibacillus albus TaxID=407036 RepID=A0A1G9AK77_9BACI|nr:alpha/beta hydrolase [Sediminibacillus albus]SDK26915.1 Pimeloyl-ACP methyl ester carboxylesterase [Sediminibacillus albus]
MTHINNIIDIGDKKLEVWIQGEGTPIIIHPGMVSSIIEWEALATEVSKEAKVILYNRAGCGKSEKGIKTRNVSENTKDLKALIDTLDLDAPVIIGHSYGGLCLQYFGIKYPNVASGFILIDSTSVDSHLLDEVEIEGEDENSTEAWIQKCNWYSTLPPKQLEIEMKDWINGLQEVVPKNRHAQIKEYMSNPVMFEALGEELEEDPKFTKEIKEFGKLPDIPTIIIGRDPNVSINDMIVEEGISFQEAEKIENIWQTLIKDQTKLNDKVEYVLAKKAGHNIHTDNPVVIKNAILSLLASIQ